MFFTIKRVLSFGKEPVLGTSGGIACASLTAFEGVGFFYSTQYGAMVHIVEPEIRNNFV